MYHCEITWITPEPPEIQHKPEHGHQQQNKHRHHQQESRELQKQQRGPADTSPHSHTGNTTPQQKQQQQHHDHLSFVHLLQSSFARDFFLASHQHRRHRGAGNEHHHTGADASSQLRSISPPGALALYHRTLLSPSPTALSVSQSCRRLH
ncbi:hypothetical protein CCHR01_15471 [Colletotrichum chrysophilum]|uniref:Uncharacterized protein n=1 Tax=Colletotrichum chrysophilum TaxID=1836956 RepID=A0AAD9E8N1_9PEZI|nr:hypothetical protein CCHR01_15471 [Colletotrichum chrysophilum]